jgi:hypothetical protein
MSWSPKQTLKEGFDKFVIRNPGACWGWSGCAPKNPGYGQFRHENKLERAHRASWILHFGEIPKGKFVLHKCDNKICSNPEHLFLGTSLDNIKDMISKNRSPVLSKHGEDNPRAKLTWDIVNKIREKLMEKTLNQASIARIFNIGPWHISAIKLNKIWRTS